jgi:cysteine synthase
VTGTSTWVKHENHQPVGAFKVRGGVNLIGQLTADERRRGVIAASTGNHGQSVAYAADLFGVRAVICMPERANPVKVESMRALGAEVVAEGLATRTAFELPQQIMRDPGALRRPEGGRHLQRRQHQPGAASGTLVRRAGLRRYPISVVGLQRVRRAARRSR